MACVSRSGREVIKKHLVNEMDLRAMIQKSLQHSEGRGDWVAQSGVAPSAQVMFLVS